MDQKAEAELKKLIASFSCDNCQVKAPMGLESAALQHNPIRFLHYLSLPSSFELTPAMEKDVLEQVSKGDDQRAMLALKLLSKSSARNAGQLLSDYSKDLFKTLQSPQLHFEKSLLLFSIVLKVYRQAESRQTQEQLESLVLGLLESAFSSKGDILRSHLQIYRAVLIKVGEGELMGLRSKLIEFTRPRVLQLIDFVSQFELRLQIHLLAIPVLALGLLRQEEVGWLSRGLPPSDSSHIDVARGLLQLLHRTVLPLAFQTDVLMNSVGYIFKLLEDFGCQLSLHESSPLLREVSLRITVLIRRQYRKEHDQLLSDLLRHTGLMSSNDGFDLTLRVMETVLLCVRGEYTRLVILLQAGKKLFACSNRLVDLKKQASLVMVLFQRPWFMAVLSKKQDDGRPDEVLSSRSKCELSISLMLAFHLVFEEAVQPRERLNLFNELKQLLDLILRTINWQKPSEPIQSTNFKLYLHLLGKALVWTSPQELFLHLNELNEVIKLKETQPRLKAQFVSAVLPLVPPSTFNFNWFEIVDNTNDFFLQLVKNPNSFKDQTDITFFQRIEVFTEALWKIFDKLGSTDSVIKSCVMNILNDVIPQLQKLQRERPVTAVIDYLEAVSGCLQAGESFRDISSGLLFRNGVPDFAYSIEFNLFRLMNEQGKPEVSIEPSIKKTIDLKLDSRRFRPVNVMPLMAAASLTVQINRVQMPFVFLTLFADSKYPLGPLSVSVMHSECCSLESSSLVLQKKKHTKLIVELLQQKQARLFFQVCMGKTFIGRGEFAIRAEDLLSPCCLHGLQDFFKRCLKTEWRSGEVGIGEGAWMGITGSIFMVQKSRGSKTIRTHLSEKQLKQILATA